MVSETNAIPTENLERIDQRLGDDTEYRLIQDGKVAGAAGWAVRAAANSFMCTVAQSQTAGTLAMPLPNLKKGDKIIGFDIIGQIDSGGNTATLDCQLYESLPVLGASTHTAITGTDMTQVSVSADTKLSKANTRKSFTEQYQKVVAEDAAYFALLTATTGATTDIEVIGLILHVKPAR